MMASAELLPAGVLSEDSYSVTRSSRMKALLEDDGSSFAVKSAFEKDLFSGSAVAEETGSATGTVTVHTGILKAEPVSSVIAAVSPGTVAVESSGFISAGAGGLVWNADENNCQEIGLRNKAQSGWFTWIVEEGISEVIFFGIPAGNYECSYALEDEGNPVFTSFSAAAGSSGPQKFTGTSEGKANLFFASANGKWSAGYAAEHQGFRNVWSGTKERVSLAGKNKIADVFIGGRDELVMLLTDDANGDALFNEDLFTSFGSEGARLAWIQDVYAGAGDDIIDLTGQKFAYNGEELSIHGGDGNDVIWAGGSDNDICGDAGNDRIIGSAGFDVIAGGWGDDVMHSGGGDDIFTFCENFGNDIVEITDEAEITFWFAAGNIRYWNSESRIYNDGSNSVTVKGGPNSSIELNFGADYSSEEYWDLYDADAFEGRSHSKIFEDDSRAFLA